MTTKLLFDVGDIVNVDSPYSHKYTGKGQIVALRHAVGNTRLGSLSMGADILLANGRVVFVYLHDLAKDNADKLGALR
jgi:hypothetical protein